MKCLAVIPLAVIVAALAGCATDTQHLTLAPVGPDHPTTTAPVTTHGTLVVYSAYEANADFNARDPYRPEYSDYTIYTPDGKVWQRVHNNDGSILQGAVAVALPAGKYSVVAQANGYGFVTVPVIVANDQTTSLHLEGGSWTAGNIGKSANTVTLPDGQVVGWRAD